MTITSKEIIRDPFYALTSAKEYDIIVELCRSTKISTEQAPGSSIHHAVNEMIADCESEHVVRVLRLLPELTYVNDAGASYDELPELYPHEDYADYIELKKNPGAYRNSYEWDEETLDTPLHSALRYNCIDLVKALVEQLNVDISHHGHRALALARHLGRAHIIDYLMSRAKK